MKHRIGRMLIVAVVVFALLMSLLLLWKPAQPENSRWLNADAAVVLGGTSTDRIVLASRIHQSRLANRFVITGDMDEILDALRNTGIPDSALIHEIRATNTVENALFSKPILERLGAKRVIIVTSWYHAGRAQRVFQYVCPDIDFSVAYIPESESQDPNGRRMLLREKFAIFHSTLVRGIPCIW